MDTLNDASSGIKAIALISGGLDSILAAELILGQGIKLAALNFISPFCQCNHKSDSCFMAKEAAQKLGMNFKVINLGEEYLEIVKRPRFGYGANLNPCIDCRILMLKKAKEFMKETGASFIITGEVLGQRPMSQKMHMLKLIERESQLDGLILRPLSAGLLDETLPEKNGWVRRASLLSLSGRSRRAQLSLAKEKDISDYSCPSGGCLLTDSGFSRRLKDLMQNFEDFSLKDVELLKIGRHFRLGLNSKLIVGRDEKENLRLENYKEYGNIYFDPDPLKGPVALGKGNFEDPETIELSARILARYCDHDKEEPILIKYFSEGPNQSEGKDISVGPLELEKLEIYRI
ncbi:MAG: tRNA 4-thiouridine(8) synthase ThiI [Candidatus Omnitrophota bacterium]